MTIIQVDNLTKRFACREVEQIIGISSTSRHPEEETEIAAVVEDLAVAQPFTRKVIYRE